MTWRSKKNKEIALDYIYRQAVLLRGGSLVPPQKVVSLKKGRGKKRKKRREENRRKEKTKEEKVTEISSEFRKEGNKIRKL